VSWPVPNRNLFLIPICCIQTFFSTAEFIILLVTVRGRPKAEIPLSAETESRLKVAYHIRRKLYDVPLKVKQDFRWKTETESQSCLGWHNYRSQQVPPSVHCPTIPWSDIFHPSLPYEPHGVSLMTRPTVPDADEDNAAASSVYSQYTVRLMTPCI